LLDAIRVLQLGTSDFNKIYNVPDYIELEFSENFINAPKVAYDLIFVDRSLSDNEIELLERVTKAYTLYVVEGVEFNASMRFYYARSKGKTIQRADIQGFLENEAKNYFAKPYGEKMRISNFAVAHGFKGTVKWDGYYSINLEGDYGAEYKQIIYLRNNLPLAKENALDIWLEYEKDDSVQLEMEVTLYKSGEVATELKSWLFSEKDLDELVTLDNGIHNGGLFISIRAKGYGKFKFIALHDRISRRGHGCFLPGGKREVFSNREELFYYFDPGDMKPPLNIYFSGYKTQQGFEGYYMMKKMGCPFLLITEPRLEGGAFYMGNEEYEKGIYRIISQHMEELGFNSSQVIMSGLSMGTFGALYYGCDILPHAIIIGKPLANIGDVASNERIHRPGAFPTSLDVVNYLEGSIDSTAINAVNKRFWDKFDKTEWTDSKLIVAYMIEDDYDSKAYNNLISHTKSDGVQIYGKGLHGRHNDATGGIVAWFKTQYNKVLKEDFSRRIDK